MLDDFLASGGGSQNPRLKIVLHRCSDAMGGWFEALDVILLGVHTARLQGLAERADEVLMPEDAAELVALNGQFGLFLAQFQEWADYVRGISEGFSTPEAEQKAVADLNAALHKAKQKSPDLVSADAQEGLDGLAEAAIPEPSPENPTPIAPPVERRSYLRAGRSALLAFASDAMTSARKGTLKGIESGAEKVTMATLVGIAGYATALGTGLPVEFGWLAGVITFLKSVLAKADGGQAADRDVSESDDDLIDT
jgi:hypothetical protein